MSLTTLKAGSFTIRGRSLGGFYTGLHIPELNALLDVGTALRTGAGSRNLFLSHAHADHVGSLPGLLGMRGLVGVPHTLRVFMPRETVEGVTKALEHLSEVHRWSLAIDVVPMEPGQVERVKGDLYVRAIKTLHPVPSLGYVFFRKIKKLREEFKSLPGPEIGRLRHSGADIFDELERLEFGYATDTLPEVLANNPELYQVKTLILECTFLDDRKSVKAARAGCHIHLDELLPLMDHFQNERVVLMHFSQIYSPNDVRAIFEKRCPEHQRERFKLFVPDGEEWWD